MEATRGRKFRMEVSNLKTLYEIFWVSGRPGGERWRFNGTFVLYLEFMLAFALLHSRDVLYLYINKKKPVKLTISNRNIFPIVRIRI